MTSDLHRSSASPTRDRIRVVFLIHTLESGGAEGQLVELIRGLPTDRFECRVICLVRGGFHEETVRSLGPAIDILGYSPMRRSDGSLEWGGLLSFVPAFIRLVRILRRFRPHVLQNVLLMSDFMGALATLFTGRPRIRLVGSRRFN